MVITVGGGGALLGGPSPSLHKHACLGVAQALDHVFFTSSDLDLRVSLHGPNVLSCRLDGCAG